MTNPPAWRVFHCVTSFCNGSGIAINDCRLMGRTRNAAGKVFRYFITGECYSSGTSSLFPHLSGICTGPPLLWTAPCLALRERNNHEDSISDPGMRCRPRRLLRQLEPAQNDLWRFVRHIRRYGICSRRLWHHAPFFRCQQHHRNRYPLGHQQFRHFRQSRPYLRPIPACQIS